MDFVNGFPYTNFHELNTDWIVKIVKDFLDQYTHIQQIIADGEQSITTLTEEELARILQQTEDELAVLRALSEELQTAMRTLNGELITQFRADANAKTAECLEDIPLDYTALSSRVSQMKQVLVDSLGIRQLCTYTDFTDGYYASSVDGSLVPNTDFCVSPFLEVSPGDYIIMLGIVPGAQIAYYDAAQNFIAGEGTDTAYRKIPFPSTAKYIRWSTTVAQKNTTLAGVWLWTICENLRTVMNLVYGLDIIEHHAWFDGYYANYIDGGMAPSASFTVTTPLRVLPGTRLTIAGGSGGSQIAMYDESMQFVSGYFIGEGTEFNIPNDSRIAYLRWCTLIANKASAKITVRISDTPAVLTITPSTGLLNGMIAANSLHVDKVIVMPGTYDLITEYQTKYGATYFDTYAADYNGLANGPFDRGLWLDHVDVEFVPGSYVTSMYTGTNDNVKRYFSAIAVGSNVRIKGLNLDASNVRYGVHPDFATSQEDYLIMDTCDLHNLSNLDGHPKNRAVGAGLSVHSNWLFRNCLFRSDGEYDVLSIHNAGSGDAQSKVTIEDCFIVGAGYFRLASYYTSTKITYAWIHGCSWETAPQAVKETPESNVNIHVVAWNNETRN